MQWRLRRFWSRDKFESSIYIMVDTLYYLKKGGRITPAAAALGTLLKLKPVLQIQGEKLDAFAKARTVKQAKNLMIEAMKHDFAERFHDPERKEYASGDGVHVRSGCCGSSSSRRCRKHFRDWRFIWIRCH